MPIYKYKTGSGAVRYRAMWRDSTRRQHGKVFKTRRDAQFHLDNVVHDRMAGRERDWRAGRQTFGDLWEEVHQATDYAAATRDLHDLVWRKWLGVIEHVPIGEVDSRMVDGLLGPVKKQGMWEKVRLVLSSMFQWAVDRNRIPSNPARRERQPRVRATRRSSSNGRHRRLSPDDLRRLVAEVPERYRAMVRLMAFIGLRPGEARALTVGQVGPVLTIDRAAGPEGETKTGEAREIPLPSSVHRLLEEHIARWSDPTEPDALVFTTASGTPVQKDALRHLLARACQRAAIKPAVAPNDLRHSAAAMAIEAGANVYAVQRMLGHAKPSITLDVYGYLWDGSLERLAEQLDATFLAATQRN